MMHFVGPELTTAQLLATIAFADVPGASRILFYTTPMPVGGGAPGGPAQAEILLAVPCATVSLGVPTLHPADASGVMVTATGIPRWARWERSDGKLLVDGDVTDLAGDGVFKVAGGATPPGDNSPMLFSGGLMLLGATTLI